MTWLRSATSPRGTVSLKRLSRLLGGAQRPNPVHRRWDWGAAFVKVSDVKYENDYQDTAESPPIYDPPLSFYNSIQDVDYSDTVVAGRLHAGADYNLNDRMLLGAKLTYTLVDDIADTGVYDSHPMQQAGDPPFTNQTTFSAAHSWSLAIALKHRLGR